MLASGARATVGLGLVHTPAPHGNSPPDLVHDAECGLAVVADAILYNRSELGVELGLGAKARAADVLLAGYGRWRRGLFERLDGDFAIVIWDGRAGELLAARDPFGVRSLHYWSSGRQLIIASEAKQILVGGGAVADPDLHRLAEFVLHKPNAAVTRSFFREIARVAAGHVLIADGVRLKQERFWHLPRRVPASAPRSADRVEQFRALFSSAVAKRLVSDTPVLVELSGGLDSSSIAAVASHLEQTGQTSSRIAALSYTYEGLPTDETQYIRPFLAERKLEWIAVPCEMRGLETLSSTAMWQTDSPFVDAQLLMRVQAEAVAHARGARVLLSGLAGDDVLYDLDALGDLVFSGRWLALAREHPSWRQIVGRVAPASLMKLIRSGRRKLPEAWREWASENIDSYLPQPSPMPPNLTLLQADLWRWLVQQTSLHWVTGWYASGTEGLDLEPRFPFLDRDLYAFLCAVPLHERLPRGVSKRLLREALVDELPPIVRDRRSKADFSSYYTLVLKAAWPALREQVLEGAHLSQAADALIARDRADAFLRRWELDPSPDWGVTSAAWRIACTRLWLASLSRYRDEALASSRMDPR